MYSTFNDKTICLCNYTTSYKYLTLQERCNGLGQAYFKIIFQTQEYDFLQIEKVMDYLLDLSLIQKDFPNKDDILDDLEELVAFLVQSCWKGDFHAYNYL